MPLQEAWIYAKTPLNFIIFYIYILRPALQEHLRANRNIVRMMTRDLHILDLMTLQNSWLCIYQQVRASKKKGELHITLLLMRETVHKVSSQAA